MIAESSQLRRNIKDRGFPFKFTCNGDQRVYYVGYFHKQTVTYSTRDAQKLNGIQVVYNIDIVDCRKIVRDFPNITEDQVYDIVEQLMPQCIAIEKSGALDIKNQVFNVSIP